MPPSKVRPEHAAGDVEPPITVDHPDHQSAPIVLASPHSGRDYPSTFLAQSRLDGLTLRRSEDSFVDELFCGRRGIGSAPGLSPVSAGLL